MKGVLLSRRYATALVDVGVTDNKVDRYGEEIAAFSETLRRIPEAVEVLTVPLFPRQLRKDVLVRVAGELGLSEIVKNYLLLLLEKGRIGHLPQIVEAYREIVDRRRGRLHAQVGCAKPLDEETADRLAKLLSRRFGNEVLLKVEVDPALIGGIRVQVGSVVIDGSVRGRLESLRERLMRG